MRILITGGAGFIGSHLAERLLARGDQVLAIDNYSTGRRDNLQPHAALEIVEGTIVDGTMVNRVFEAFRPDILVHAAASYKDPNAWPEDASTNTLGTTLVVQAAQATGVQRIIYFQTSLCYGTMPLEQPISLDHPLRPDSSYAISKTAAEQYIAMSGIDWQSFRLANMYGPRNLSGPVPTFYQRLSAGKPVFVADTRRDFMYIHDMLDVVMGSIDGKGEAGPFHIASGADSPIKDLYAAVSRALGQEPDPNVEVKPRTPDDAATILLDAAKTEQVFSWKPRTELAEGVAAAVDWYNEFGVTETYTHLKLPPEGK